MRKHVVVAGARTAAILAPGRRWSNYGDRLARRCRCQRHRRLRELPRPTRRPTGRTSGARNMAMRRDPDMRAFLRRISPLTNAERITRPLLVVHGKNDPRVPVSSEAEQIVNKLRSDGRRGLVSAGSDEGHGFRKKQNRDAYYQNLRAIHPVAALRRRLNAANAAEQAQERRVPERVGAGSGDVHRPGARGTRESQGARWRSRPTRARPRTFPSG